MMQRRKLATLALLAATSLALATGVAIAQQRLFFGIATGGTGGTYYPLGGMLAQLISNKATVGGQKVSATAEAAGASVGNAKLLGNKEIESAFVAADILLGSPHEVHTASSPREKQGSRSRSVERLLLVSAVVPVTEPRPSQISPPVTAGRPAPTAVRRAGDAPAEVQSSATVSTSWAHCLSAGWVAPGGGVTRDDSWRQVIAAIDLRSV